MSYLDCFRTRKVLENQLLRFDFINNMMPKKGEKGLLDPFDSKRSTFWLSTKIAVNMILVYFYTNMLVNNKISNKTLKYNSHFYSAITYFSWWPIQRYFLHFRTVFWGRSAPTCGRGCCVSLWACRRAWAAGSRVWTPSATRRTRRISALVIWEQMNIN